MKSFRSWILVLSVITAGHALWVASFTALMMT